MRFLAVLMMSIVGCDDVADEDVFIADFDMAAEPSCTACLPATTHTLDITLRPIAAASNIPVECEVEGDANVRVGQRGGALAEVAGPDMRTLVTGETMALQYDFQCTGDGVLKITCTEPVPNRRTFVRTSEEPITCLAPAGPAHAVLDVTATTSAFALFIYSSAVAFSDSIVAEAAQITGLPIGSCVKYVRNFANVTLESAGTVEIKNNSALVATLDKSPSSERREFGPFTLAQGTAYDIVIGGAGAVAASIGNDVLRPAPIATFTSLGFVDDTITSPTFTYQPVAADYLFMIFSYLAGSTPVQLWCRLDPAGTSYTMSQPDFDGLGFSGTVRAETQNRGTFPLGGTNTSVMVNAHSSTMGGQFTKP